MPTLRKRVKRFDEEVAPPFVNISTAKLKNLRLKRFEVILSTTYINHKYDFSDTGQVFSKRIKITPKFTFENLKNSLRSGALLGVISDIHRLLWVSADPNFT